MRIWRATPAEAGDVASSRSAPCHVQYQTAGGALPGRSISNSASTTV
jgi:hypothetical protein